MAQGGLTHTAPDAPCESSAGGNGGPLFLEVDADGVWVGGGGAGVKQDLVACASGCSDRRQSS